MNNNDALLSFLGLCRRAGKMTLGFDVVLDSVIKGESDLVLMAEDISRHTEKGILRTARECNVKVIKLKKSKEEISMALGKFSAVVSINDGGFAKKIETIIAQNSNGEECNL